MKVLETIGDVRRFFEKRIWSAGVSEARRGRAVLYRTSRILYATVSGFQEKRLTSRAAALTYYSVLSIVPFLGFAFAILKGFGGYQKVVDGSLRPYLQSTFGESPGLMRAFDQILSFVEGTNVSGLGVVGGLFLAYSSVSLLTTIESALNDIWGAKTSRPVLRQVTDYTTLLVITPLLVMTALTFATAALSSGAVMYLRDNLGLGPLINFALKLTSLVLGCVAMIAIYLIMPNVRTRLSSAVIGGVIGGLLWQGALILHVRFQVGVKNYNALYSGFGAIPIFLVWLYTSWLIVLIGAQIAAAHQYEQTMRQTFRAQHVDQELREMLAIAIVGEVTRGFLDGRPPRQPTALADALEAPPPAVEEVLGALVHNGILVRAVCGNEIGYLPAQDVDRLRLADVRDAVRRVEAAAELKTTVEGHLSPRLCQLLRAHDAGEHDDPGNITLRALANFVPSTTDIEARPRQPARDVVDAKQPGVPA